MTALSDHLTALLGPEIDNADEETFLLFAHDRPAAQNLGFLDRRVTVLDLAVAGRDLVVHQSPAVLTSARAGGTTGAVLWKITPAVAEWLAAPSNFLFSAANGGPDGDGLAPLLGPQSAVLELGCGISGVIGLTLTAPRAAPSTRPAARRAGKRTKPAGTRPTAVHTNAVGHYVLTDQPYVAKLVQQNLEANTAEHRRPASLYFRPLDWETDVVSAALLRPPTDEHSHSHSHGHSHHGHHGPPHPDPPADSFDAILACDCIYNDALVAPLVQTCADACRLREAGPRPPTICIVCQQLREPDVLSGWLTEFHAAFRVWRVPETLLTEALWPAVGFAVHVGILR